MPACSILRKGSEPLVPYKEQGPERQDLLLEPDGYGWRKQGEKNLQNPPRSRSYFRCSEFKSHDCPALKFVDFCFKTGTRPAASFILYQQQHNHQPQPLTSDNPLPVHKVTLPPQVESVSLPAVVKASDDMKNEPGSEEGVQNLPSSEASVLKTVENASKHLWNFSQRGFGKVSPPNEEDLLEPNTPGLALREKRHPDQTGILDLRFQRTKVGSVFRRNSLNPSHVPSKKHPLPARPEEHLLKKPKHSSAQDDRSRRRTNDNSIAKPPAKSMPAEEVTISRSRCLNGEGPTPLEASRSFLFAENSSKGAVESSTECIPVLPSRLEDHRHPPWVYRYQQFPAPEMECYHGESYSPHWPAMPPPPQYCFSWAPGPFGPPTSLAHDNEPQDQLHQERDECEDFIEYPSYEGPSDYPAYPSFYWYCPYGEAYVSYPYDQEYQCIQNNQSCNPWSHQQSAGPFSFNETCHPYGWWDSGLEERRRLPSSQPKVDPMDGRSGAAGTGCMDSSARMEVVPDIETALRRNHKKVEGSCEREGSHGEGCNDGERCQDGKVCCDGDRCQFMGTQQRRESCAGPDSSVSNPGLCCQGGAERDRMQGTNEVPDVGKLADKPPSGSGMSLDQICDILGVHCPKSFPE